MKIKSQYLCQITTPSITSFLNNIKNNKIRINNLQQKSTYSYTFYSSLTCFKHIKKLYPSVIILKKIGIFNIFKSLFKYKTTLICMIISCAFYISLSNRIWKIRIIGDQDSINPIIESQLVKNKIFVGAKKMNKESISNIQNKLLYNNYDIIEYLSIKSDGCSITVNFKKKRKQTTTKESKKSLYAKRDGVIKSFDLLSGEKVVSINDYVKKGDLLVKDILTTDYKEEIYVGTFGCVYAYTWYYVSINEKNSSIEDKETVFANYLLASKQKISENFSDNEYIFEENVLQFNVEKDELKMKIHFTCVENIAKE